MGKGTLIVNLIKIEIIFLQIAIARPHEALMYYFALSLVPDEDNNGAL